MKILHIVRGLANVSGPTHIVRALSEHQARMGHHVEVFAVENDGEPPVVPDPKLVTTRLFPALFRSRAIGISPQFWKALRRRVGEFDLVHIHMIWNFPTWCGAREAWLAGVPYIIAPQGSMEAWALARHRICKWIYGTLFENRFYHRAACFQALSLSEVEQIRHFGVRTRIERLANGVTLETHNGGARDPAVRERLGIPPGDLVLLFLGRIFPKKGLNLLAEAFGALCAERNDVTLVIAGHDAGTGHLAEVERHLEETGARGKTVFAGEVRGEAKFALLRAADLFVLSSYSEGLPMAVLEAMACRLPVLITPGCNLPEVTDCEAGWVVETTAERVADGLRTALASTEELMRRGNRAYRLVEDRFTWEKIAAQSVGLYEELVAARGRKATSA